MYIMLRLCNVFLCAILFLSDDPNRNSSVIASTAPRVLKHSSSPTTRDALTSGYSVLGDALHSLYYPSISSSKLTSILKSLAGAQSTLKRLDGISHELYQRTHSSTPYEDTQTTVGRASRSASRTGSCADALFGCELCSWIHDYYLLSKQTEEEENQQQQQQQQQQQPDNNDMGWNSSMGTLQEEGGRHILFTTRFNYTVFFKRASEIDSSTQRLQRLDIPISVVILHEPFYRGMCGLHHGGIDALLIQQQEQTSKSASVNQPSNQVTNGRILVIINDSLEGNLEKTLQVLNTEPEFIDLDVGLISQELACVNTHLWKCAALVLSKIGPSIQTLSQSIAKSVNAINNTTTIQQQSATPFAFHFVGRSLAGGIAALSAAMMDGCIPMPPITTPTTLREISKKRIRKREKKSKSIIGPSVTNKTSIVAETNEEMTTAMHAYGQGCTSAITLGSPPCLSSNVKAAFVTSIIHGDDIISRCSRASLDRLKQRIDRCLHGGFIAEKVGWVSDTFSLTVSALFKTFICR